MPAWSLRGRVWFRRWGVVVAQCVGGPLAGAGDVLAKGGDPRVGQCLPPQGSECFDPLHRVLGKGVGLAAQPLCRTGRCRARGRGVADHGPLHHLAHRLRTTAVLSNWPLRTRLRRTQLRSTATVGRPAVTRRPAPARIRDRYAAPVAGSFHQLLVHHHGVVTAADAGLSRAVDFVNCRLLFRHTRKFRPLHFRDPAGDPVYSRAEPVIKTPHVSSHTKSDLRGGLGGVCAQP